MWDIFHSMKTIQVVLESELLRATDSAARKARINRSALVRKALREHLKRAEIRKMEERERRGYERHPQHPAEIELWEREIAWPER